MIACVTLNPSWDVTHVCRGWSAGGVVRAVETYAYTAGKGINVARGLRDLGIATVSLGMAGGIVGEQIRRSEASEYSEWVEIAGCSRCNLTLVDPDTRHEIHSVSAGPEVSAEEWKRFLSAFESALDSAPIKLLFLGGSLPPGVPADAYRSLVQRAQSRNIPSLVDASGVALRHAVTARPWAIKPNRDELAELVSRPLEDESAVIAAARQVVESGIELVAVSLGADGAVAVTAGAVARASPPHVTVVNTVGCGDAFVAGLLRATLMSSELEEHLRVAVAAGSANATVSAPGAIPDIFRDLQAQVRCQYVP